MRRIPMHMKDWITKLDSFLQVNDRDILTHAGKISHEMALELAEDEYEKFSQLRIADESKQESDFDKLVKKLPPATKKGKKK